MVSKTRGVRSKGMASLCLIWIRANFIANLVTTMCGLQSPKDYVVAATGELQDEEEKKWMIDNLRHPITKVEKPVAQTEKNNHKKISDKNQIRFAGNQYDCPRYCN